MWGRGLARLTTNKPPRVPRARRALTVSDPQDERWEEQEEKLTHHKHDSAIYVCVLAALGAAKDLCQQLAAQSVLSHYTLSARRHTHGAHSCIVSLLPPSLGSDLWLCDLLPAPSRRGGEKWGKEGKKERKKTKPRPDRGGSELFTSL